MDSYEVNSCVRGHHIYKNIWTPYIGEYLNCEKEANNPEDPYAVAMMKDQLVVGHIPRKISAACSLFLAKESSTITCLITGNRKHSWDLPQGGLDVPCQLIFKGEKVAISKIKKLVAAIPEVPCVQPEPPSKIRKVDITVNEKTSTGTVVVNLDENSDSSEEPQVRMWLTLNDKYLIDEDKAIITLGKNLTDKHINFAQEILKKQFVFANGLMSTLNLEATAPVNPTNYKQIVHTKGNHWIVFSTIGCLPNNVLIYDSLYANIDETTTALLHTMFGDNITYEVKIAAKQVGLNDCGLFAIANCVSLLHWCQPGNYVQQRMRLPLQQCFEQKSFLKFP